MKAEAEKLADLQKQMRDLINEVRDKRLTKPQAADRIVAIKDEMDEVIKHLKSTQN